MIRDAKTAGLLAMAVLPVQLYARRREYDQARKAVARGQPPRVSQHPVVNGDAASAPPLPGVDGFGPLGGVRPGWHNDPGRVPELPGYGGVGGFGPSGIPPTASSEGTRPEFLLEPDRVGMFGSDALTAPPVIGEECAPT